jgi:hypothetical protein
MADGALPFARPQPSRNEQGTSIMAETLRRLAGLGSRYFSTREEAERDLARRRELDATKHAKWDVHEYTLPEPDSRTVFGATGGAAVLGWQIATDFGFEATKGNGGKKQKTADEQMGEMTQEQRFATIAKSMNLPIEKVRAMFTEPAPATAASDKPVDSASGTTGETKSGKGGRK